MNASYRWLRDFVDVDLTPHQIADLLTSRCATVEGIESTRTDLADIVIGRVIKAGRHPNSDHLWLTSVDTGGAAPSQVVCGAPNVVEGALYPFAAVGSTLPGGLRIEKRKIRGVVSEGMLCSARELGLGSDHEGILQLDVDAMPGTPFLDAVGAGDSRIIVDVLPNRPDLLSHEGLAREIAAATGVGLSRPQHPPAVLTRRAAESRAPGVTVTVEDHDGTPRYMTAAIRGVTVGPSPDWLRERIEAIGGRSISNVVDATNYMLHGFGQPMHAFDLARLEGGRVIVRRARAGEKLLTLDGIDRELDESMTVIADANAAHAIGGVIGGKGSEVSGQTTDVLLEVAAFEPRRIRATRKKLGISTDASYRFERGVDVDALPELLKYAVELITRVSGGSADGEPTDAYTVPRAAPRIRVRPERVNALLGEDIPVPEIQSHLGMAGFTVAADGRALRVSPPSYRADVTGEAEVIEEVARLRGYDTFSSEMRPFRIGTVPEAPLSIVTGRVREECIAAGLLEARPMPFVRDGEDSHRVRNPLAEDEAYLRSRILDTLARRVEHNFAHMQRNVRLFEIGTVFIPQRVASGAPGERVHVGAVIAGQRTPAHFTDPHPPAFDRWDAKGLAARIATAAYPDALIECDPTVGDAMWTVTANDEAVGSVFLVRLDAPVWAAPVFGIELDLEVEAARPHEAEPARRFVPIPSFPAIEADLALLVPDGVTADQITAVITKAAGELMESLAVFDEFRGQGIPPGTRSLAWRLTFRHPERTLRDREIHGRIAKILSSLEAALGIRQRTS